MDLDRTSVGDRAQRQRATATPQQEPLGPQQDAPQPVQPDHGGPLAASRDQELSTLEPGDREAAEARAQAAAEAQAEALTRRNAAVSRIARFLRIPGNAEVDIRVDDARDQVFFQVLNRDTGELLSEYPEDEARGLIEKLREFRGVLLDRRL